MGINSDANGVYQVSARQHLIDQQLPSIIVAGLLPAQDDLISQRGLTWKNYVLQMDRLKGSRQSPIVDDRIEKHARQFNFIHAGEEQGRRENGYSQYMNNYRMGAFFNPPRSIDPARSILTT